MCIINNTAHNYKHTHLQFKMHLKFLIIFQLIQATSYAQNYNMDNNSSNLINPTKNIIDQHIIQPSTSRVNLL